MLQVISINSTTDYRARVVYVLSVETLATYQLVGTLEVTTSMYYLSV